MKNSEEFLKELPPQEEFLQLAKKVGNKNVSTGPHILQLLRDEKGVKKNFRTNVKEEVMWYYFRDVGTGKLYKYAVPIKNRDGDIHYLIQKLGPLPENSIVELTYVNKPNDVGGFVQVNVLDTKTEPVAPVSDQQVKGTEGNAPEADELLDDFGDGDIRGYKDYGDFENEAEGFDNIGD